MKEKIKEFLFQKVSCTGYLKEVQDGKRIHRFRGGEYQYINYYDEPQPLPNCWLSSRDKKIVNEFGRSDFIKTYYEEVESGFDGIVIGYKDIELKAELYLDVDEQDNTFVAKRPVETVTALVVAYACNKNRLVPLAHIKEA